MNKQLALRTKEYLLEILSWSTDNNRKLAVQCIGEIAEEALQGLNEYLSTEEKTEETRSYECTGSCEDCNCDDLTPAPETKE